MLTDAVLRELAALGPYFVVETHSRGRAPGEPWHVLRELVDDPTVLADRVAAVRARLAVAAGQPTDAVERRVAASVTHLGLVARLISPVLAVAVAPGLLWEIDLGEWRWQRVLGGAFPLSVPVEADQGSAVRDRDAQAGPEVAGLTALLASRVLDGPVRTLVEAVVPMSVSPQILWGNVASAVHGAAAVIATARPSWADLARAIASQLLSRAPLRGTGSTVHGRFRRRSCCLIYRAAPNRSGAVCGDCVLAGGTRR